MADSVADAVVTPIVQPVVHGVLAPIVEPALQPIVHGVLAPIVDDVIVEPIGSGSMVPAAVATVAAEPQAEAVEIKPSAAIPVAPAAGSIVTGRAATTSQQRSAAWAASREQPGPLDAAAAPQARPASTQTTLDHASDEGPHNTPNNRSSERDATPLGMPATLPSTSSPTGSGNSQNRGEANPGSSWFAVVPATPATGGTGAWWFTCDPFGRHATTVLSVIERPG